MTTLGIDLSLRSTGWALIHDDGQIRTGTIKTTAPHATTLSQRRQRLQQIRAALWLIAYNNRPDVVVVEGPSYGSRGGRVHDRSGLWWLVVDSLLVNHSVAVVPPASRASYATGNGLAGKQQVLAAARTMHELVAGNDEADALILAAMGARWLRSPVDDTTPWKITAMQGVEWPS